MNEAKKVKATGLAWGLKVPGRPQTPSEGHAMQYTRVGPVGDQLLVSYDNGTCLQFGPNDPVDEFETHHPFADQNALIDKCIKDIKASRDRYQPNKNMVNGQSITGDEDVKEDPFDSFRDYEQVGTMANIVTLESGIYKQVPSRYATLGNSISIFAQTNKGDVAGEAHPGYSQDTRFGQTSKPPPGTAPRHSKHREYAFKHNEQKYRSILPPKDKRQPNNQSRQGLRHEDNQNAQVMRDDRNGNGSSTGQGGAPLSGPLQGHSAPRVNLPPVERGGLPFPRVTDYSAQASRSSSSDNSRHASVEKVTGYLNNQELRALQDRQSSSSGYQSDPFVEQQRNEFAYTPQQAPQSDFITPHGEPISHGSSQYERQSFDQMMQQNLERSLKRHRQEQQQQQQRIGNWQQNDPYRSLSQYQERPPPNLNRSPQYINYLDDQNGISRQMGSLSWRGDQINDEANPRLLRAPGAQPVRPRSSETLPGPSTTTGLQQFPVMYSREGRSQQSLQTDVSNIADRLRPSSDFTVGNSMASREAKIPSVFGPLRGGNERAGFIGGHGSDNESGLPPPARIIAPPRVGRRLWAKDGLDVSRASSPGGGARLESPEPEEVVYGHKRGRRGRGGKGHNRLDSRRSVSATP